MVQLLTPYTDPEHHNASQTIMMLNALKNVPEYLECTQNLVGMFRMHFEYQRMYHEFSFRRHSGSFRHSCD